MILVDSTPIRGPPLQTLRSYPYLAQYVKRYRQDYRPHDHSVIDAWHYLCPSPSPTSSIPMSNLKELIIDSTGAVKSFPDDILHGQTEFNFRLDTFRFSAMNSPANVPIGVVTTFLATQPNLRVLEIYLDLATHSVPPDVCPNLEVLDGDWETIALILPGRRIPTLVWHRDSFSDIVDSLALDRLEKELGKVLVLSLKGDSCAPYYLDLVIGLSIPQPPSLSLLASYCPDVEILELADIDNSEIRFALQDCTDGASAANFNFPSLRGIVIAGVLTREDFNTALERDEPGARKYFARYPLLEFVDFQTVVPGTKDHTISRIFERWTLPAGGDRMTAPLMRREVRYCQVDLSLLSQV